MKKWPITGRVGKSETRRKKKKKNMLAVDVILILQYTHTIIASRTSSPACKNYCYDVSTLLSVDKAFTRKREISGCVVIVPVIVLLFYLSSLVFAESVDPPLLTFIRISPDIWSTCTG